MAVAPRLLVASASAAGSAEPLHNDDRVLIDGHARLYALVDARGPTYGGWHRPTGVESGWRALRRRWLTGDEDAPVERLRAALTAANRAMFDPAFFNPRYARQDPWHPTASMTILGVHDERAALAQIGSSRAYLVREGDTRRVLADHTLWTEQEARGASRDPAFALVVSRVLGFAEHVELDITTLELRVGDRLALCSDGLWFPLEPTLPALLREPATPEGLAARLLEAARAAAAIDHHSALVVDVIAP
ncbi:MAG: hypothetical protein H6713_17815 [Myxococcales bacterium]|nr:hypothetical protein [Myxococcales bacterium]